MSLTLPRANLAFLPTPVHPMKNLANSLGFDELWIKRDDLTGLTFGGNKSRKLEYIIGEALEKGADTVVTVGGVQSNHCRQTAAFAAAAGLRCILLLAGEEPKVTEANLLLDKLFGAELKFFPEETPFQLNESLDSVVETLEDQGFEPYPIPIGAANALGSLSYALAVDELAKQMKEKNVDIKRIILAEGTGGTQAGILAGIQKYGLDCEVIGIGVMESAEESTKRIISLLQQMTEEYGEFLGKMEPEIAVIDRFQGEGYGILDSATKTAIEMFAKMEGIILDPVYTGKAGLALIQMSLAGDLDTSKPTLFWHTGGVPTLFPSTRDFFNE
jgi:D-cysteine desulfhydrase family pyridoxal phosphate-dependent enzyme